MRSLGNATDTNLGGCLPSSKARVSESHLVYDGYDFPRFIDDGCTEGLHPVITSAICARLLSRSFAAREAAGNCCFETHGFGCWVP